MRSITCLSASNIHLTSEMSETLYQGALHMLEHGIGRKPVKLRNVLEGRIETEFKVVSLAGFSGTWFSAEVETELGKGQVSFLVRRAPDHKDYARHMYN